VSHVISGKTLDSLDCFRARDQRQPSGIAKPGPEHRAPALLKPCVCPVHKYGFRTTELVCALQPSPTHKLKWRLLETVALQLVNCKSGDCERARVFAGETGRKRQRPSCNGTQAADTHAAECDVCACHGIRKGNTASAQAENRRLNAF
jgi:hypothetical protein